MTTQEKIKFILEALASKKATANQVEPSRKGATIAAIKQGKTVRPSTIDKLYASLQAILAGKPKSQEPREEPREEQPKESANQPATQADASLSALSARVAALEKENTELKATVTDLVSRVASQTQITKDASLSALSARVAALEKENTELKATVTDLVSRVASQTQITKDNQVCATDSSTKNNIISDTGGILGNGDVIRAHEIDFVVRLESQNVKIALADGTAKNLEYKRYYAKKKIAGKLHRVYLGDTARRNESMAKIETYCQKHGLNKATQERQLELFP